MFINQFKHLFRTLMAGGFYTFINIVGLAVGIASIVWAYQDVRFGLSFDNFHPDQERIFRVITKNQAGEGLNGYCPLPIAVFAPKDFSSVVSAVRWEDLYLSVKGAQEETFGARVDYTDPAFFEYFNFPLIKGSNDLTNKSAILITESEATKYFGSKDPLGQTLILHAGESYQQPLTVTGILKDLPLNSSLQFSMLTNFNNYIKSDGTFLKSDEWSWMADAIFIKLPNPQDVARLEQDFNKYLPLQNNSRKDIQTQSFIIEPLREVSNHDDDMAANALRERPNNSAIYGPTVLAILILLSACLNFANTTVARYNRRLKEMGVRKVLGGSTSQLIVQQLVECSAIVFFAILLSILFNKWWLPTFNGMFDGIKLEAHYLNDRSLMQFMIFLLIAVTVLAGLYPAYYVSKYNATQIFRGGVKFGGSNLFSRILLGMQIVIAFITVTAGFSFARNAAFQRDFNFGFNQNNIVGIWTPKETYQPMRDALAQINGIEAMAGSRNHIGFSWRNLGIEAEGIKNEIKYLEVGDDYLDVMGVNLLYGRDFSTGEADYQKSAIISENLCSLYGWKSQDALNKQIKIDTLTYSVIGVTKNIYMGGFFNRLEPILMVKTLNQDYANLIIKAKPNSLHTLMDQLKATWTELYPLRPFNSFYQDELATEAQKVNESIAKIFFWFALISVMLTATGMFALISLTVLKKTREIAIRRVVGAKLSDIVIVIHKNYLLIFVVASILGIFAGASLTKLLMDLIFKINIGINMVTILQSFMGVCLLIAFVIGLKIWQVNKMRPAAVLKSNQ